MFSRVAIASTPCWVAAEWGDVYQARHLNLDVDVAVQGDDAGDLRPHGPAAAIRQFQQEAQMLTTSTTRVASGARFLR